MNYGVLLGDAFFVLYLFIMILPFGWRKLSASGKCIKICFLCLLSSFWIMC